MRQLSHANFSVTHRRRAITVYGAKITLTINKSFAHRERLRHSHYRVINCSISVRVILTNHITDNSCRFFVRLVIVISEHIHGIKDTPVDRLQAISNIWQCPTNNDTHSVFQIGTTHFIFYRYYRVFWFKKFLRIGIVRHTINLLRELDFILP